MKKFPIAIERKIAVIKELLPKVAESENIPITYDGGTFPSYVNIDKIVVKNQFVTIYGGDSMYDYIGQQRYNVSKVDMFDEMGRADLMYTLNVIIKAFKSATKN